jgi:hypothetical protein
MKCYDCAVAGVRATGNRRGESIFLRHQGDLMRVLGQDGAVGKLEASLRAAQACRATDLAWYAHAALANALIAGDAEPPASKLAETRHRLAAGIDYARKIGLPKLEADIRKVQGHMALRDGDTAAAADAAIEVMSIAAMFGMELRVTATLILMGRVAKACGRWEGARSYFTAALQMAEFQRYQLQAEVARNELAAIVVEDSSAGAIASND